MDSLKSIIEKPGKDSIKADAIFQIAQDYFNANNYDSSIFYFSKIIDLFSNDSASQNAIDYLIDANDQICMIYYHLGNYDAAIKYNNNTMKLFERKKDTLGIANSLNNLAFMLQIQKLYDESLEYFRKAVSYYESSNNLYHVEASSMVNNIGFVYEKMRQFDSARFYYDKSLMIRQQIGDKRGISESFNNIGNLSKKLNQLDTSIFYLTKSLELKKEIGDKTGITYVYDNLASASFMQNKIDRALNYAKEAYDLSKRLNFTEGLKFSSFSLYKIYKKMNREKESLEMYETHILMRDSLNNENSLRSAMQQKFQYEFEIKETVAKQEQEKKDALVIEQKKRQNAILFFTCMGLILVAVFAFFMYKRWKITQQQKIIIEKKNNSLENAYKHIEEKNTEILDSIRYAKRIQEAILPPQKLVKQYLEQSFILYKPKDIVAGDFYWMHIPSLPIAIGTERGQGGEVFFACCDCTGHGVPGAFVSILGYNGLNRCVKEFGLTKPSEILDKLCELVDEAFSKSENDIKDGMDIALCSLEMPNPERVLNPFGVIQYAGAGNSLYHIRNGNLSEYAPDKQPIGKFAYRKPFTNHEIQLEKGDSIYIFTDGYADQFGGPKGKKFKYKQFENLLLSIQDKSMSEQREILNETIDSWRGEMEQVDDICIIGVRV